MTADRCDGGTGRCRRTSTGPPGSPLFERSSRKVVSMTIDSPETTDGDDPDDICGVFKRPGGRASGPGSRSTSASGRGRTASRCSGGSCGSRSGCGARTASVPSRANTSNGSRPGTPRSRAVFARPNDAGATETEFFLTTEPEPDRSPPDDLATTVVMPSDSAAPPPRPDPVRIGRYTVRAFLGEGNFRVYLASDDRDGRTWRSRSPAPKTRRPAAADVARRRGREDQGAPAPAGRQA